MMIQNMMLKIGVAASILAMAAAAQAGRISTNVGFDIGNVRVSVPIRAPVNYETGYFQSSRPYIAPQQQVLTTYSNGYQSQTVTTNTYTPQVVYVQPARVVYNRSYNDCYGGHRCNRTRYGYSGRNDYHTDYQSQLSSDRNHGNHDDYRRDHVYRNDRDTYRRDAQRSVYVPISVPTSQQQSTTQTVRPINTPATSDRPTHMRPYGL